MSLAKERWQPGPRLLPDRLEVVAWEQPDEGPTWPVTSWYAEACWLPVVGPTALWLWRRLVLLDGHTVDTPWLGRVLGISIGTAPGARLPKTFERLVGFQVARWTGVATGGPWHERVEVRMAAPPLQDHHLRRVAEEVRAEHYRLLAARRSA